uniref:VTT domain-containing protein n=1 Tax=Litorilinea aerophila TaxID=1204385 RepID=A0A540VGP5_9CHLR
MQFLTQLIDLIRSTLQNGALPDLGAWTYVLLALLVAVEGPIATLLGAAAASAGFMRLDLVFLAAAAGNLTADILWYGLGYLGTVERLYRHGRWLGIQKRHIDRLVQGMHDHATKLVLMAKLTAGFMIPTLIAAGLARVSWRKWFLPIVVGEMIWTGALTWLGYHATQSLQRIEANLETFGWIASLVFVAVALWYIRHTLTQRTRAELENETEQKDETEEDGAEEQRTPTFKEG